MKKILPFFLFISFIFAGCSLNPFAADVVPKEGDTVVVHYVGTYDNGEEFESSRSEGRSPLTFVLGAAGTIKGFEDAVRSMKLGEKKKVRIEPADAYGEQYIERTMPVSQYKEVVTETVPSNALTGNVEQKMPKARAQQFFSSVEVGSEKKMGEASLKIVAVSGEDVVISVDDPKAPFYGKTLTVWMKNILKDGTELMIKKIDTKDQTVDVEIKQKQEIISKTENEITVKVANPHPLAGKALNFEIELIEIKPAQPNTAQPSQS